MIWRQAAEAVTIENTYIPKGTNVIVSPQVSQSHPDSHADRSDVSGLPGEAGTDGRVKRQNPKAPVHPNQVPENHRM